MSALILELVLGMTSLVITSHCSIIFYFRINHILFWISFSYGLVYGPWFDIGLAWWFGGRDDLVELV